MASMQEYQQPTPGGLGVGNLLGLAASASAYDYFLLKSRRFGNIATSGIPQGVFGTRFVGRRMRGASGRGMFASGLRGVGGFLSGQGSAFGMFQSPIVAAPFSTRASRIVFDKKLGVQYVGMSRLSGIGYSLNTSLFDEATTASIRSQIGNLSVKESFSTKATDALVGQFKHLSATESAMTRTAVRRAATLSGIGKVAGGILPGVNAILLGKLAIDLAGMAGGAIGSLASGFVNTLPRAMSSVRGTEFGGPTQVFQLSGAVTERQRAIAEIQRSSMNSRFLLGNEAAMYAQS